jgi:predicted histidine transporter YuiF (NhaC family)
MIAKLIPYDNAPSSSGSLVTTNKPNNKENFHSGDILSLYTLIKNNKKKKLKESCICSRCLIIHYFRTTLIHATVAFIPQVMPPPSCYYRL